MSTHSPPALLSTVALQTPLCPRVGTLYMILLAQIQLTHLFIKNLVLCFYDKCMIALALAMALATQPSII